MGYVQISDAVFLTDGPFSILGTTELESLAQAAERSQRGRARYCAHEDTTDPVQEMLIAVTKWSYIRPHRHLGVSESYHLVAGRMDIVMFDDDGAVTEVVELGAPASGLPFYLRIADSRIHMPLVQTDQVVFHETKKGPFDDTSSEFPAWAPVEGALEDCEKFVAGVRKSAERLKDK